MKLLEKLGHRSRTVALAVVLGGMISATFAAFGNTAVPLAFGSVCLAASVCFGLLERSGHRESTKAQRRHLLLLTSVAGKIDKLLAAGQAHKRSLHGLALSADAVTKDLGALNKDLRLIAGKIDTVLEVDAGLTENVETVRDQQTTAMKVSKSRQAVLYADMGRLLESQDRVLRRLDAVRTDQKTDGELLTATHADSAQLRAELANIRDVIAKAPEPITEEALKTRFIANSSRLTKWIEQALEEQSHAARTMREAEVEEIRNVILSALAMHRAELSMLSDPLLDDLRGPKS